MTNSRESNIHRTVQKNVETEDKDEGIETRREKNRGVVGMLMSGDLIKVS